MSDTPTCQACLAEFDRITLAACTHVLSSGTGTSGVIADGMIAVCPYCGGVSSFSGDGYRTRHATDAELVAALRHPVVRLVRAHVRARRLLEEHGE